MTLMVKTRVRSGVLMMPHKEALGFSERQQCLGLETLHYGQNTHNTQEPASNEYGDKWFIISMPNLLKAKR